MKTIQFKANQILNRNHQPITHNGVIIMASNMVINTFIITNIYSY